MKHQARDAAEIEDAEESGVKEPQYVVPGLERGLRILTEFSPREPVLGAPELARRLGIPRTTVFRLLQTLEASGFLERADKDRNYRLGVAVLRLGFEYLSSLELTDLGLPILEKLRDDTGLTCHILIRDGRDVVFVAKAQSREPIFSSVKVNVGTRLPAHATIHGQVLMADLSFGDLKTLYPEAELQQFTPHTPGTVDELYQRIREDAERGYAISESSFERGISVVSAPVRNDTGKVVAVVTVTLPRPEIEQDELTTSLVQQVCGAADDLSARLNYRPPQPAAVAASAAAKPAKGGGKNKKHYLKSLGVE